MDTKVQKMINYVKDNGPCRWVDIQKNVVCDGLLYSASRTTRGHGCSGVWVCVKQPARGRNEYIRKDIKDGLYRAFIKDPDIYKSGAAFDKVNTIYSNMPVSAMSRQTSKDKCWLNELMVILAKGGVMSKSDKIECNRLWKIYKK